MVRLSNSDLFIFVFEYSISSSLLNISTTIFKTLHGSLLHKTFSLGLEFLHKKNGTI